MSRAFSPSVPSITGSSRLVPFKLSSARSVTLRILRLTLRYRCAGRYHTCATGPARCANPERGGVFSAYRPKVCFTDEERGPPAGNFCMSPEWHTECSIAQGNAVRRKRPAQPSAVRRRRPAPTKCRAPEVSQASKEERNEHVHRWREGRPFTDRDRTKLRPQLVDRLCHRSGRRSIDRCGGRSFGDAVKRHGNATTAWNRGQAAGRENAGCDLRRDGERARQARRGESRDQRNAD